MMAEPMHGRPGETRLGFDPAAEPGDAHLVFIGRVHSPRTAADCPKNLREARVRLRTGSLAQPWLEIAPRFRLALTGLDAHAHILVLAWLDRARRDLAVLAKRHVAAPRGVLALRSPVRPNPIAVDIVRLLHVDVAAGRLDIDAIDLIDGTPLLDVKPYLASVDAVGSE